MEHDRDYTKGTENTSTSLGWAQYFRPALDPAALRSAQTRLLAALLRRPTLLPFLAPSKIDNRHFPADLQPALHAVRGAGGEVNKIRASLRDNPLLDRLYRLGVEIDSRAALTLAKQIVDTHQNPEPTDPDDGEKQHYRNKEEDAGNEHDEQAEVDAPPTVPTDYEEPNVKEAIETNGGAETPNPKRYGGDIDFAVLMEPVAQRLLGEPKEKHRGDLEWRYGSNGSLKIDVAKGTWSDFEANEGGGVLALIAY
jgi:hypothetical protein